MFDGYYSHHPTIRLVRPLILTGTFHSDARKVAHFLVGQTGLTLLDVDDAVAHQLGMSLVGLRHRDGQYAYLKEERAALLRLVKQKPAGVIRVGRDPLAHVKTMANATSHGDILFIQRHPEYEAPKYAKRLSLSHWVNQRRVERHYGDVEQHAAHVIHAGERHALSIAKSVVKLLMEPDAGDGASRASGA